MVATTLPGVLLTGNHASRPAANAVASGTLYACSTHSLIYQSDGSSWSTWATLGTGASGSITASGYTQNTARLLGRTTASSGAIEEITVGSGLSLAAGSLTASGGGGATLGVLGYDTIGGSVEVTTTRQWYAKKVTTTGACILTDIEAHFIWGADDVGEMGVALFEDTGSSAPGKALSYNNVDAVTMDLSEASGTRNYRWFGMAIGYKLAASSDYWIAVAFRANTTAPSIHYDGSGSDLTFQPGGSTLRLLDGPYVSNTNSTRKYSIRANTIG